MRIARLGRLALSYLIRARDSALVPVTSHHRPIADSAHPMIPSMALYGARMRVNIQRLNS